MKLQRYEPDTCECIIDMRHDGVDVFLHKIVSKCSAHKMLSDEEVWDAVWEQNLRKNAVMEHARIDLGLDSEVDEGIGAEYLTWEYEGEGADRVLRVKLSEKVTSKQKRALRKTVKLKTKRVIIE